MLWFIIAVLLIIWLVGWSFHVVGNLIHAVLIVVLVLTIFNLATRKKTI